MWVRTQNTPLVHPRVPFDVMRVRFSRPVVRCSAIVVVALLAHGASLRAQSIRGVVVDPGGTDVAGVVVTLLDSVTNGIGRALSNMRGGGGNVLQSLEARTDSSGRYHICHVPLRTALQLRALTDGARAAAVPVQIDSGVFAHGDLVVDRPDAHHLGELLSTLVGVHVTGKSPRAYVAGSRGPRSITSGSCLATVYLDHMLMYGRPGDPSFDVNTIPPEQIEAIEYYASVAVTPMEYSTLNSQRGVIVIRTRR